MMWHYKKYALLYVSCKKYSSLTYFAIYFIENKINKKRKKNYAEVNYSLGIDQHAVRLCSL